MPSSRKKARCAYVEGRRRCVRPGQGEPPLCSIHEMVVEDTPPPLSIDDVLDDLFDRADDLVRRATNRIKRDLREVAEHRPTTGPARPRRVPPQRTPPPAPQQPRATEPDPREVLGFPPGIPLTREMVKSRQRDLAKIFHPDRQGSTAAMQRVNRAAKQLLDGL